MVAGRERERVVSGLQPRRNHTGGSEGGKETRRIGKRKRNIWQVRRNAGRSGREKIGDRIFWKRMRKTTEGEKRNTS